MYKPTRICPPTCWITPANEGPSLLCGNDPCPNGEDSMMLRKLVIVAVQSTLLTTFGFAQGAATGDLHVTVRDSKGGLVTNATVSARDESKALERATSENSDGQYRILLLPPGNYKVMVAAPGFSKSSVQGVTITVGQMAELPIVLSVAGAQEVVTVSSAAKGA